MRILVIPSWYPPDGGNFFRDSCEGLHQSGNDIFVLACEQRSLKKFSLINFIKNFRITVHDENGLKVIRSIYWKIPKVEHLNIIRWSWKIERMAGWFFKRYEQPDIIYVFSSIWAGWPASIISKKHRIPLVISEHRGRFVDNNPYAGKLMKSFYLPYLKDSFKIASRIITVSSSLQPTIQRIAGIDKNKFFTIPNSVDTEFFKPSIRSMAGNPFIFFSLGVLEYVKGMDILLKAFSQYLSSNGPDAELWIGGVGSLSDSLMNLVKELNIGSNIRFLGFLNRIQVSDIMRKADAFVLATRFEAFGVVFIEAMASGLPIIGTRSGGPEEIITPRTGIITDIDNVDQLAAAMKNIVNNYDKFDRKFIRNYAIENFSKDHIAKKHIELFNEVILEYSNRIASIS
jgi:glycosyltransferase involved in cell wall biosynthesis